MEIKHIIPDGNWLVYTDTPNNKLLEKSADVSIPLSDEDILTAQKLVSYIDGALDDDLRVKYNLRPGVGMAAPQIGINKKIIYLKVPVEKHGETVYKEYLLANPVILQKSKKIIALENGEGCLSIREAVPGLVPRSKQIDISAYDIIKEKTIYLQVSGYVSIVFQHEIDHLHGILYPMRINQKDPWREEKGWKLI